MGIGIGIDRVWRGRKKKKKKKIFDGKCFPVMILISHKWIEMEEGRRGWNEAFEGKGSSS